MFNVKRRIAKRKAKKLKTCSSRYYFQPQHFTSIFNVTELVQRIQIYGYSYITGAWYINILGSLANFLFQLKRCFPIFKTCLSTNVRKSCKELPKQKFF